MKLSIAIADIHALPSAFVVYRGFEKSIPKVAEMGFDGVELALRRASEVNIPWMQQMLGNLGLQVSCISTGQVYADGGLTLTHENKSKRQEAIQVFRELIDLAAQFGRLINIGRARGIVGDRAKEYAEQLLIEAMQDLCEYALPSNVTLMLEPVNRYETDFINTVEEGSALVRKTGMKNIGVMPDIFHMNIEDVSIAGELVKYAADIRYIHLADSNRMSPGQGHIEFLQIFDGLLSMHYNKWVSVEILPKPDPDTAARNAATFLLPLVNEHNKKLAIMHDPEKNSL